MQSMDANLAPAHDVVTCPRCQSTECHSNRVPNANAADAIGNFVADRRNGLGSRALRTLLGWAFIEIVNQLREPWTCTFCRGEFR